MAKKKTSRRHKDSNKITFEKLVPFNDPEFKDSKLVFEALVNCLKENDLESFRGILFVHIMTVNKMDLARKAGIGRRTLYDLIDPKKEFNPELSTIAAVLHALAA